MHVASRVNIFVHTEKSRHPAGIPGLHPWLVSPAGVPGWCPWLASPAGVPAREVAGARKQGSTACFCRSPHRSLVTSMGPSVSLRCSVSMALSSTGARGTGLCPVLTPSPVCWERGHGCPRQDGASSRWPHCSGGHTDKGHPVLGRPQCLDQIQTLALDKAVT